MTGYVGMADLIYMEGENWSTNVLYCYRHYFIICAVECRKHNHICKSTDKFS